jgi:multidrug transporter EmrE-like cation transporter
MIAYAAAADVARNFLMKLNDAILYPLISLMMAAALLVFLWGCFEFIMAAGDPGARTTGKKHILWGIVGMVVMVSAYGILTIAVGTFGLDIPR